jgi:hypothetical protein
MWKDFKEEEMIEWQVCSLRFVSAKGFSPKYRNHMATFLGASYFVLMILAFVSGLLGWLLVMKKRVLQCGLCGAVVNAS